MPIRPSSLTRLHVEQVIAALRTSGIPVGAQSTKFDLVVPETGERFPPKLVLSLAVELATGSPLSRRDFTGGEATNAPLRELGFLIESKPGGQVESLAIEDLVPGMTLSNDQITVSFGVGNAGGMRWSGRHQSLVVVADHTKGLYDDRWDDDVLLYTGMGRRGDQALTGQNLRLADHARTATPIHLFEVFSPFLYVYAGLVELAGSVKQERQADDAGAMRQVYVFPLRLLSGERAALPAVTAIAELGRRRRQSLKRKSDAELMVLAASGGREAPGRRLALTTSYQRSDAVAELVRRLAAGRCDLCEQSAPFETPDGPYLECHHIERLADGGADTVANAVAVCPNCHRRMHLLRSPRDLFTLRARVALRAGAFV